MSKKSLALGMVIPMAAAGAVATAPSASAAPVPDRGVTRVGICDRAVDDLTLQGRVVGANAGRIRLNLTLETNRNRSFDRWAVSLVRVADRFDPGRVILSRDIVNRFDFRGIGPRRSFEQTESVINSRRADHFMARARNLRTGETCVVRLTVGRAFQGF